MAEYSPMSLLDSNTFQNLRVSSPAALATVVPSGLIPRWRTLHWCPNRSDILVRGFSWLFWVYLHTESSFLSYPWELTNSFSNLDHTREQTYELVSWWEIYSPRSVFQNLMVLSLVPPPEARRLFCLGHQARALTAALCWVKVNLGFDYPFKSQMHRLLSFPPLASWDPSNDHLSPHTSLVWAVKVLTMPLLWALTSWFIILVSRLPLERRFPFQAREETLPVCPLRVLIRLCFYAS